jgi:RND family efflux transporter MFP subunit
MALVALAIAQIGVHLVFFLHLTTAPDNTNNALALAFGVLIVTLVVGGSLWIMSHLDRNMMPGRAMARMDLESMAEEGAVRAKGVVAPLSPAQIAGRVSGVVVSVRCEPGAHVEAGQLCAEIDPAPYRAAVEQRSAELDSMQRRLQQDEERLAVARADLERRRAAGARGKSVGRLQRSVDRLRNRVEGARASVARSQAAVGAARSALEETRIISPIEGTVRSRNVAPGQRISADARTPLFVIAPDAAHIGAAVGAEEGARLQVGDRAVVAIDTLPGQEFSGEVTKIETPREGGAGTVVDIAVSDPRHALEPGMTGTVRIPLR